MRNRYIVVQGSESGHCCFGASVVDTAVVWLEANEWGPTKYAAVCETITDADAQLVADALNALDAATTPHQHGAGNGEKHGG